MHKDMEPHQPFKFRPETRGLGFQVQNPSTTTAPPRLLNRQAAPVISVPLSLRPSPSQPQAAVKPVIQPQAPAPQIFPLELGTSKANYLTRRIAAFLVDSALNISFCLLALGFALFRMGISPRELLNQDVIFVLTAFLAIFHWALVTAQEIAFGMSLGKRFFRLQLQGGALVIFLRAFFFPFSILLGGLGLVSGLINARGRCLHDSMTDLQPITWRPQESK